jgi:hypothetical protein
MRSLLFRRRLASRILGIRGIVLCDTWAAAERESLHEDSEVNAAIMYDCGNTFALEGTNVRQDEHSPTIGTTLVSLICGVWDRVRIVYTIKQLIIILGALLFY